jgi:hypothetical protein
MRLREDAEADERNGKADHEAQGVPRHRGR